MFQLFMFILCKYPFICALKQLVSSTFCKIQELYMTVRLEPGWKEVLGPEFEKPYMVELKRFLLEEKQNHTVYPPNQFIFNAFDRTPFDQVNVVILGQDPYHNVGQAHGLSFSVPRGVDVPPSLKNIYKELQRDIQGFTSPGHGDLSAWAEQGVLLLNATLTVRAHQAGSHQKKGWERFTDQAIQLLSDRRDGLVFLLWGRYARNKAGMIDHGKHLVLQATHPSPLSAYQGFLGCGHFSAANNFLIEKGRRAVDWQI